MAEQQSAGQAGAGAAQGGSASASTAPSSASAAPATSGQASAGAAGQAAAASGTASADTGAGQAAQAAPAAGGASTTPSGVDPDTAAWLQSKGLDLGDIGADERVQKVLGMARASEAEYTKARQELKKRQDAERVQDTGAVAQEKARQTAGAQAEELSPVAQVQQQYQAAFDNLAALHGAQSAQELAQIAPAVYQRLQAAYDQEYRQALGQEAAFHAQKFTKQQETEQKQRKLEAEYEQVKSTYRANIAKAREKSPDIEQKLIQSGVVEMFGTLGKLTSVPLEYMLSDPQFFARATEMAEAVMLVKNMPKLKEQMKAEWVKDQASKASAELPSAGGSPDPRFAMGASLQKFGKGVSVLH